MTNVIKCPKCGKVLGECIGSRVRSQHEGRVWFGSPEALTCDKCHCTFDVTPKREGVPAGQEVVCK